MAKTTKELAVTLSCPGPVLLYDMDILGSTYADIDMGHNMNIDWANLQEMGHETLHACAHACTSVSHNIFSESPATLNTLR